MWGGGGGCSAELGQKQSEGGEINSSATTGDNYLPTSYQRNSSPPPSPVAWARVSQLLARAEVSRHLLARSPLLRAPRHPQPRRAHTAGLPPGVLRPVGGAPSTQRRLVRFPSLTRTQGGRGVLAALSISAGFLSLPIFPSDSLSHRLATCPPGSLFFSSSRIFLSLPVSPPVFSFPLFPPSFCLSLNSTLWDSRLSLDSLFLPPGAPFKMSFLSLGIGSPSLVPSGRGQPRASLPGGGKRMGPPGAGRRAPRSAHPSSPAPGLRRPTRHLSPALPAHTPRTPAAPPELPPPTLRLPPLPAGTDARASPAGAAPASQGIGALGVSAGPERTAPVGRGIPGSLTFAPPTFTFSSRVTRGGLSLILSTSILCSSPLYSRF